jgi:hypothetical protein
MSARLLLAVAFVFVFSSGCMATSLHSLARDHRVSEPRIFGRWHGTPPPESMHFDETTWEPAGNWVIESRPDGAFRATQRTGDVTMVYAGSVVRLGERLFLDLETDSLEWLKCSVFPIFPCHAFASLSFDGDTMLVGYLRTEWLTEAAREGELPEAVGLMLTEEGDALLTGGTPDLEALMIRAARTDEAFSIGKLVRVK